MVVPGFVWLMPAQPATPFHMAPASHRFTTDVLLGNSNGSWPTFHGGPGLWGVSNDTAISTANASRFGLDWMVPTGAPVDSSPVVGVDTGSGDSLVYVGNTAGGLEAVYASNGTILWSDYFGVPFLATPTYFNHSLWAGTFVTGKIYKLNGSTGATECSLPLGTGSLMSSPTVGIPPGGRPTVYFGIIDNGVVSSGVEAVNASTCKVDWTTVPYLNSKLSGSWNPTSFGVNATGVPVVFMGSGNPDSTVYALNANTGSTLWSNRDLHPTSADVGSGMTVSPPGMNGFASGMVYYPGMDGLLYALNMTTGKTAWTFNVHNATTPTIHLAGRSSAALVGSTLVFGTGTGVMAVNAVNGSELWDSAITVAPDTEIISSPLVTGSAGDQTVIYGDMNGSVRFLNFTTGSLLYSFQTHGFVMASPADAGGRVFVASSDGYLYAFGVGGNRSTVYPTTTISAPLNGASVPNPNSISSTTANLLINGSVAGGGTSPGVLVGVQSNGAGGPWWNSATSTWQAGVSWIRPSIAAGNWWVGVPVARAGAVWEVFAHAVATSGLTDTRGVTSTFSVLPASTGPRIALSAGWAAPRGTVAVSGTGFLPGESITLGVLGSILAVVSAGSTGSFAATTVTIPPRFPYGLTGLTATGLSGDAAIAPLDVNSPWVQLGATPARTGFLVNDLVLTSEEVPDKIYRMVLDFAYSTGAPIFASPAVALGVAYVGNTAGKFVAVDVATGVPLWSATIGGAFNSSPAVDPTLHLVIAGNSNGHVYAWNSTTGAPLWNRSTPGPVVSSPNIAKRIVYVGSNAGHLYAYNETTGKLLWSATLGGRVRSSPAIDTSKGYAVVGDDSGKVTAFFLTGSHRGSAAWSFNAGGAVTATPIVNGGYVFVSQGATEYSLVEGTGTLRWSTTFKGNLSDTSALNNGFLYLGTSGGRLFEITTAKGTIQWNATAVLGVPITGVSATDGLVFVESANGALNGYRGSSDGVWVAQSAAGLDGTVAICDNGVVVAGEDGAISVYSPYGLPLV